MQCEWHNNGSDGYGRSWHCETCGKCVFYENEQPTECIKDTGAAVLPGWSKRQEAGHLAHRG